MKALCWTGVNETAVETVDDPKILNDHDIILKVRLSTTCGSDLHLLGGYIPTMRAGDVLGHEFMGEVVEVGAAVQKRQVGRPGRRRARSSPAVSAGTASTSCTHCATTATPIPASLRRLWGSAIGGCFAYSHALGGFAGSHAEYVRVPYADQGAFPVPDGVSTIVGAVRFRRRTDRLDGRRPAPAITPGDTVAVWGAGGVGQMAARAAMLLGAERVIVIDRLPNG